MFSFIQKLLAKWKDSSEPWCTGSRNAGNLRSIHDAIAFDGKIHFGFDFDSGNQASQPQDHRRCG